MAFINPIIFVYAVISVISPRLARNIAAKFWRLFGLAVIPESTTWELNNVRAIGIVIVAIQVLLVFAFRSHWNSIVYI